MSNPGNPFTRKLQVGEVDYPCSKDSDCDSGSCDTTNKFGCNQEAPVCTLPPVYTLRKSASVCESTDTDLGEFAGNSFPVDDSLASCARKCADTDGCRFFTYGRTCLYACSAGDAASLTE